MTTDATTSPIRPAFDAYEGYWALDSSHALLSKFGGENPIVTIDGSHMADETEQPGPTFDVVLATPRTVSFGSSEYLMTRYDKVPQEWLRRPTAVDVLDEQNHADAAEDVAHGKYMSAKIEFEARRDHAAAMNGLYEDVYNAEVQA